jgi:hypothetical protein
MNLEAPAANQVIRITEEKKPGDLEFHSFFKYANTTETTTPVPGVDQLPDSELHWLMPRWQAGVDLDFAASGRTSFTGSFSYSEMSYGSVINPTFGVAISRSDSISATRFDFTLYVNSFNYDAVLFRQTTQGNDVIDTEFLDVSGSSTRVNPSFMFTFNMRQPRMPIFLNVGFGWQTLYDLDIARSSDFYADDISFRSGYTSVAAGLYGSTGKNSRIVFGARLTGYSIGELRPVTSLFLQFDFSLR